jgi:hypothetical protein
MKKSDIPTMIEIVGVSLVTIGVGLFSIPIALIALGSFLVWITEKNS